MARDVNAVLIKILMSKGDMDKAGAENYLKRLQSKGRFSSDVWS